MHTRTLGAAALAVVFLFSAGTAGASTLSVSCSGASATSTITWTATTSGGVAPVALLWSTGTSTNPLTLSYVSGAYSMNVQATDASSSVATSTCSATIAAATSSSDTSGVSSQIQALLSQIQTLQQQLRDLIVAHVGQSASSTPSIIPPGQVAKTMCITINRDLEEGDSGDDVRTIQDLLASDPAYGFTVAPTGFFGELTAHALMRFQEINDIASSTVGRVGPLTRGFFQQHCGKGEGNNGAAASSTDNSSNGHGPWWQSTTTISVPAPHVDFGTTTIVVPGVGTTSITIPGLQGQDHWNIHLPAIGMPMQLFGGGK